MKRTLTSKRILLTGASSGIGRALTLQLAKEGAELVVVARRGDRLASLIDEVEAASSDHRDGKRKILTVVGDITEESVRAEALAVAERELGGLDILINNAGQGATALLEQTAETTLRRMMEVNYFALVLLTQRAIPILRRGREPMVVNLSSIVGLRGVPHYGAYGAAKFAVTGATESLRAELARDKIDVLLVCPGTTQTEFFDVLLESSSAPTMPVHQMVSADYVAARIVRAMRRGNHRIIPYFQAVILDMLQRLSPRLVDAILARYV
ncbi:MAG: SDR family NAD(P)-dependent oxidoreductase [Thermoguttaceae bacterium]